MQKRQLAYQQIGNSIEPYCMNDTVYRKYQKAGKQRKSAVFRLFLSILIYLSILFEFLLPIQILFWLQSLLSPHL